MPARPVDVRTAEDRARMRAREKRYLDSHPEQREKKAAYSHRRYQTDPDFRRRIAEANQRWREKRRQQSAALEHN